jgi:serine/threonine protein kinase/ABC-type phosphate/phosphonate transport system substrate-binding protein
LRDALDLGDKQPPAASAAATRSRTGRRLGDYELLNQIGRGGMGVVYQAHQFSLNRDVALKLVLDANQSSPRAIGRFQLEAEAAARLNHPNIVPIYEIAEVEEQHFLTMKLIEGESLARRMSGGEFRIAAGRQSSESVHQLQVRIVRLVITVARAVHYAHERGVLHRDIKPGNILMDEAGEPHLTDFGLAKLANDSATVVSESGAIAGTPAYMAPEQARGERLSRAADIYSLGVVLYELLTGKPPFTAATPLETMRLITDQEPANPTTTSNGLIDADLATISLKCLEKNPAARYASAQELAEDLERWLKHEPIRARPLGPVARLQRWGRRNPVGASFIVVLVAGIATTSVLLERLRVRNQMITQQNNLIRESLMAKVDIFYERAQEFTETISAEEIAALLNIPQNRQHFRGPPLRLKLALTVPQLPMDQVLSKGYGLAQVSERMSSLLHTQVLIDLKLFKPGGGKVDSLLKGDTHFKRMGALPYLAAKAKDPSLVLVARDADEKEGVLFTRQGGGITNLSRIAGERVAFGDEDATISFQAKVELVHGGIVGTNLAAWEHLRRKRRLGHGMDASTNEDDRPEIPSSHARAIQAVRLGEYDVGVGRWEYVRDFTKQELQIIHRFFSSPNFWVASGKVAPKVVEAFRQALTGYGPTQITVGPEQIKKISAIVPADDDYFDGVRRAMTNEVRVFEGDRPVQSRLRITQEGGDDE